MVGRRQSRLVDAGSRVLVAAALCLGGSWSLAGEPRAEPMPELEQPAEERLITGVVYRVIDGDSIELFLNSKVVVYELAGMDAPEVLGEGEVVLRGSLEAREYLSRLVDGEQIAVLPDTRRSRDARGRLRGYLYRMPDRLFLNLEMVRLGHAKHTRDPKGFNNLVLRWAQGRARGAHKGVWAPVPETVVVLPALEPAVAEEADSVVDEPVEQAEDDGGGAGGLVVYVTKFGSKYHLKDCQHVHDSAIAKRRDELDDLYSACKVCDPDESVEE